MSGQCLVMREGYCVDCKHLPEESIVEASKTPKHPCNGCWFSDDKSNWEAKDSIDRAIELVERYSGNKKGRCGTN